MGSLFSIFSRPKEEVSKAEIPFRRETKLFGSATENLKSPAAEDLSMPQMDTTSASPLENSTASDANGGDQVPTLKRKRVDNRDEPSSPSKVPRRCSPNHPSTKTASERSAMPTSSSIRGSKRKRSVRDEEHGASAKAARTYSPVHSSDAYDSDRSSSPPMLKRKRSLNDDEHGSSSKAPRIHSPVSSGADDTDRGTPPPVLKRKRRLDDDEHGALSKAARTYSPINSSESGFSDTQPTTLKRKRRLDDDEHGALSKAARTYSPIHSWESDFSDTQRSPSTLKRRLSCDSGDEVASPKKRIRYSKRNQNNSNRPESSASYPASSRPANKRKHANSSDSLSNDDEDAEVPHKRPRHTSPVHQEASCSKPKRVLPWLDADYPYYTKRSRIDIPEDENYPAQVTQKYDGLRYYKTNENATVKWDRFGVLLGEITHLTVPKPTPTPVQGEGNNSTGNASSHGNLIPGFPLPTIPLPPRPPPPASGPAPIHKLSRRQQHQKASAKAKRQAKKSVKMPPKVENKKTVKERYEVYAKFNHNMRFVLKIVPEITITSTEYRSTNPEKGKKNSTQGQVPVRMETTTRKVHYGKQTQVGLEQFDIYIDLGRMVWEEGWKDVFEKGRNENGGIRDGEDVGEGLAEMSGLLAVMRKVMECPPPDVNIARRIRCFHATGKFDGSVRGI